MLVGGAAFLGSEVVLSPVVSGCLPSCRGWVLVGVAASRTKIFRNQNHRFQFKFAYCKLFGVYAGVIFQPNGKFFTGFLTTLDLLHLMTSPREPSSVTVPGLDFFEQEVFKVCFLTLFFVPDHLSLLKSEPASN